MPRNSDVDKITQIDGKNIVRNIPTSTNYDVIWNFPLVFFEVYLVLVRVPTQPIVTILLVKVTNKCVRPIINVPKPLTE